MKIGTVVLVIHKHENAYKLIETFSNDQEITLFEEAFNRNHSDPLRVVLEYRSQQKQEDEAFGDFVENLLSQPFLRQEIQHHGIEWLKSKIKIEQFQKNEEEATAVIAHYAFRLFEEDRNRPEFFLVGPKAKVRIRVFTVTSEQMTAPAERRAA